MEPPPRASPVPLSPFEHLMLADARPGHPMTFFLECVVAGDLDRERLRRAVAQAALRHPATRSRVAWRWGRPHWLPPDVSPEFVWLPGRDEAVWRSPDLGRESGVRIVVRERAPGRYGVVLVVHHAVCDGVAACEFFGDTWAAYEGVEPRPFTAAAPPGAAGTAPESATTGGADVVGETLAFARFSPAPLARVPVGLLQAAANDGGPPFASFELDADATRRLRDAAASRGVTVNDLVVAAVMRAAAEWNERAGSRRGGIRVNMPVNMRAVRERRPAANAIGYAFLDRSRPQCGARESLVRFLASASRWVLQSGAAARFLEAVAALDRFPGVLLLATRLPVCLATVTVSNVGDVGRRMRAGVPRVDGRDAPAGLEILGFAGVPPLRPGTRAAVGVLGYGAGLTICCACSAHPEPRAGGAAFLDLVLAEISGFIGPEP